MRLQCPNCDAEYEVDAAAIPQEGRDVQCSNCGHGWFQTHPDYEPDYELDAVLYEPPPQFSSVETAFPKHEIDPAAMQILREEAAREEAMRAAEQAALAEAQAQAEVQAQMQTDVARQSPVQAVMDEDAAQLQSRSDLDPASNHNAQAAAQPVPDTQPQPKTDAGDVEANLDALRDQELPMPRIAARVTRRRIARLRGENDDEFDPTRAPHNTASEAGPAPAPVSDSDSSWFDPTSPGHDDGRAGMGADQLGDADALRAKLDPGPVLARSGRRAGIYTALLAAALALGLYAMGPALAARVPALASPIAAYLDGVNALRDSLQTAVPAVMEFAARLTQLLRGWIGV